MSKKVLALFDVDGTLTRPRGEITPEMKSFMDSLKVRVDVGIVGGSDLPKQQEQLGDDVLSQYPWNFSQNGLVAYRSGAPLATQSLSAFLGEANIKRLVNWTLRYVADLDIPVKRGTFLEYRTGMLNISPIGRNCDREERDEFERFDKEAGVRKAMVEAMREQFKDLDLTYSIGGQISFDVFPRGWDKTYCLQFLTEYDEVHFFGDKTFEGGNDYEIFNHERTIGHTVTSPDDTMKQCKELFF